MVPSPFSAEISFSALPLESAHLESLLPEEEAILSERATEKRRLQFRAGRAAARLALKQLGIESSIPILKGGNREPIFPDGVIGSIAHCRDLAVAAACKSGNVIGVGVDVEEANREDVVQILPQIATEAERSWIEMDTKELRTRALIIFSAKESIYKALFPLHRRYFGFKDVNLISKGGYDNFSAVATKDSSIAHFLPLNVGIRITQTHILSGVAYSQSATSPV